MSSRTAIAAEERKWAAESDVRTLTEAEVIQKTPSRLRAAKTAAKRMVKEEQQKVNAINKVAGSSSKETTIKKSASKREEKTKSKPPVPGKADFAAMVKI